MTGVARSSALLLLLVLAAGCTGSTVAQVAAPSPPSTTAGGSPTTAAGAPIDAATPIAAGTPVDAATPIAAVEMRIEVRDRRVTNSPGRPVIPLHRHVVLTVAADAADEVHVHGYDLHADAVPGQLATIAFDADIPGQFEAELEHAHLHLLRFEVR